MTSELFRREVLDARKEHWLGTVRLTTSRLAWPMTLLAVAAVVMILLLLVFGHYTRKQRVAGRLVPSDGLLTVAAPVDGVVARIMLHEGQAAAAGQPLLEISSELGSAAFPGGVGTAVGSELLRQKQRLEADLADMARSESKQTAALRQRIDSLSRQTAATDERYRLRRTQAENARALLERIRPLQQQQIVSAVQVEQYETAALDAQAQVETSLQEKLDAQRQLDQARTELDALPLDLGVRRSEIERGLADVAQSAARNQVERSVQLHAPRAGTVAGLAVDAGQAVAKGQRVLSLIPGDSTLRAELMVPSRAVGTLTVGTRVAMRYHAFPYQKYGQRYGRVIEISRSALSPEEVLARTGTAVDAPAYRAIVRLDRQSESSSSALPLRATMTLDADLLLERRRLYEFVLEPLRSVRPPQPQDAAVQEPGE